MQCSESGYIPDARSVISLPTGSGSVILNYGFGFCSWFWIHILNNFNKEEISEKFLCSYWKIKKIGNVQPIWQNFSFNGHNGDVGFGSSRISNLLASWIWIRISNKDLPVRGSGSRFGFGRNIYQSGIMFVWLSFGREKQTLQICQAKHKVQVVRSEGKYHHIDYKHSFYSLLSGVYCTVNP